MQSQAALGHFPQAVQNLHLAISLSAPKDFPEAAQVALLAVRVALLIVNVSQELDSIESHLRAQNAEDAQQFDEDCVYEEDSDDSRNNLDVSFYE